MDEQIRYRKLTSLFIIIGLITVLLFSTIGASDVFAQEEEPPTPEAISQYAATRTLVAENGESIEELIISGPPTPPEGFEEERQAIEPPPNLRGVSKTLTVPAYDWVFGCSAVSGSMIAAYYDRNGYPNMYTGPTDGGVMPLNNSVWGSWSDGVDTYPNNPLTASHNGVDGRSTRGSIDDYWVQYGSSASDPYISGGWSQHSWSDAIGDYMKTSQSAYSNTDGSTTFYTWTTNAAPLTCADMVTNNITQDGTYGRKLFYEARGYTVTDCYNQKTDNNGGGFTYAMYKAEIDAGRPVLINLDGHSIVGVGYDDSSNSVYIHDTWDYTTKSMTWGGSYSGMSMLSVSIVNLQQSCNTPAAPTLSEPDNGAALNDTTPYFAWSASADASVYEFILDNDSDFSSPLVDSASLTDTSYTAAASLNDGTYYWKVRGRNTAAGCSVNGPWSTTRSLTINLPVAADDTYETLQGSPLTEEAPGVLENDTDPANADLSAVKVSDPAHGTLTLNADGSFTYTPEAGYTGSDSFTYKANNGAKDSNTATVTINVVKGNWPLYLKPYNGYALRPGIIKVKMSWKVPEGKKARDISSYEAQVATDPDFTNIIASKTRSAKAPNWTLGGLLPDTTYYWRVRAIFRAAPATGAWSSLNQITSFSTQLTRPPTLRAPGNKSKQMKATVVLKWKRPVGCPTDTSYVLQYSADPTFAAGVTEKTVYATSYTISDLPVSVTPGSTLYYWRVKAMDLGGTKDYSNWSAARSFKR
jgi:VCBS repeat-containing protein/YD repeat-containing protein